MFTLELEAQEAIHFISPSTRTVHLSLSKVVMRLGCADGLIAVFPPGDVFSCGEPSWSYYRTIGWTQGRALSGAVPDIYDRWLRQR